MLSEQLVDRAVAEIRKGYAQYQYFFERLDSPEWLDPLAARGFFKDPPPPEEVGEYVRLPFWPESRYLVRMAAVAEAQASVLRIALEIPMTKNSRVYDDIVDIALLLPADGAARLLAQATVGVRLPIKLVLQDRIGDLIRHLADGGQPVPAVSLGRTTLGLAPDPKPEPPDDELGLHTPEPQPVIRDWYYARIIERALPSLVHAARIEAVRLFSDLLDDAIRLSQKPSDDAANDEDYLYISYPAIEHGHGRDNVPRILIEATRDASQQLISADPTQFAAVIEILDRKRWITFRRLKLHLCRIFPELGLAAAEEMLSDPETLNRGSLQHEAVLLLKALFARFSADGQQRVLACIDAGRPEEALRGWLEFTGQPVTNESIKRLSDMWRRDHYAVLQGQLPEAYQLKLDELVTSLGGPSALGEPRMISYGAVGAQSPKSDEELDGMSIEEILAFLRSWKPGTDIFQPTAEGLGKAVTSRLAKEPGKFLGYAKQFEGLDPTYVRAFLGGVLVALKEKVMFDWRPVLELAEWVVRQPREIPGRTGQLMVADPGWGWTRDSLIDLLTAGFDRRLPGRLGYDLRTLVWRVLQPLTDDPNPSTEHEGGKKFDPGHLSINSTRGRAIHAVVEYARWARLSTDPERNAKEQPPISFNEMPEVREVLEAHLDTSREPTLTIRAVYGHHLNILAALDSDWLRANLDRIFPTDDPPRFKSAWDDFIAYNSINTGLLSSLASAYRTALEAIDRSGNGHPRSPADALAEHLMVYYWLGMTSFETADGLMVEFYAVAPDAVRGHAIWFIGTSVPGWTDAPPEAFNRLQDLFARRLAAANGAPSPEQFRKELKNFGHWFTSEKFDEQWSMDNLLGALRIAKKAEPEMEVVKRLAELCPKYPVQCVASLRLMIEGDHEGWLLLGVEDDARRVLKSALESNDPEGVLTARRLAEELIAKGQFGFRQLLN